MTDLVAAINSANTNELKLILANVEKRLAETGGTIPVRFSGAAEIPVPEETKHLPRQQLGMAAASFASWYEAGKNGIQKRSRGRLWMAFLLLRHGALRLGEVLAIDDRVDFNEQNSLVTIRGSRPRSVLLPEATMRKIASLLASPMYCSMRGTVFHLDQGYLRRIFYERAKACGLPGELLNPRVIRHSRAIELLQGGVPLQVVHSFLGQQNLGMTSQYLEFSDKTSQRIVWEYITKEGKMKTSARNAFTGKVSRIVQDGLLVEVEVTTLSRLQVVAIITEESFNNLALAEGSVATAVVKAPWVILAHPEDHRTSARNRYLGTIVEVKTSPVACEVITALPDGTHLCALVTMESVNNLDLKPGREILVTFKAFSVLLNVE